MTADAWRSDGWATLPSYRVDLVGEFEEPFVLQVVGTPDDLADDLRTAGWRRPAAWDAVGTMAWLAAGDLATLPVLPKLHDGRAPALMLELPAPTDRKRLVLRLWDSHVRIAGNGESQPLWLGTVTREDLHQPMGLVSVTVTETDANGPRDLLADTIVALRRTRTDSGAGDANWDGTVLLVPLALRSGVNR